MRNIWLVACVALCAAGSAPGAGRAEDARPGAGKIEAGFPSYSRQEETQVCLLGYGTENSSILDCVARDEKYRTTLAHMWPSLDDKYKTSCVDRLANRHLNSYFYLDRCIHSLETEKDAADPD